jgi:hypothetical protein
LKRVVVRPWGTKWKGGVVLSNKSLLDVLKGGDVLEVKGLQVGAKQLFSLIRLFPHDHVAIHVNGRLEIQSVDTQSVRGKDGQYKVHYRTPKRNTQFLGLAKGAWVPSGMVKVAVLRPKLF